jgi:4-cresol dehydrogenase (hydroxylating)
MAANLTIPKWSFGGGIHGTRAQVRAATASLRRALRGLGRLTVLTDKRARILEQFNDWVANMQGNRLIERWVAAGFRGVTGKSIKLAAIAPAVHSVMKGIPSDYFVQHAYFKSRLPKSPDANPDRDDCGLMWFAPVAPCTGTHVRKVIDLCRPLFEKHVFDFYAALLTQNSRSVIVLMSIFFDKARRDETERASALYDELSETTRLAGYQQYRTGTNGMASLFKRSPEYANLVRRLKHALDPAGVLAPGKTPP